MNNTNYMLDKAIAGAIGSLPSVSEQPVFEAINGLDKAVELLGDRIGVLSKRMESVMAMAEPVGTKSEGIPSRCALDSRLNEIRQRVQFITECVESYSNRLCI